MRKPLFKVRNSGVYDGVPEHVLQARGLDVTFENERTGGEARSEPIVGVDFVLDRMLKMGKERQADQD